MIELNDILTEIEVVEKNILNSSELKIEGSYEHWNILNTVNHAYCWKNCALKKVELRLEGKESKFHSVEPLDTINRAFFNQTENYTQMQTIAVIEESLKRARIIIEKISGHESSRELAPNGYNGDVLKYLICDLIYHPINHYIYYAIKNSEYKIFMILEEYIKRNEKVLFKDDRLLSVKGLIEIDGSNKIFAKENKWKDNELYIKVKDYSL